MGRAWLPFRHPKHSVALLLLLSLPLLLSGSGAGGARSGDVYLYFMSKREGYYGIFRSELLRSEHRGIRPSRGKLRESGFPMGFLPRVEELYSSGTVLEKFPGMARYQVSYDVSRDGKFLVYGGLSGRGNMDIFLLDLWSGAVKNITDDENVDSRPVFSEDGASIAYLTHEPGGRHYDNIALTARDGSGKRLLTRDFFRILSLEFLPGDMEILIVKYLPFHSAIVKVALTSGQLCYLTDFIFSNRSPSVNPDGSAIVYASDRHGSFDIWIMESDGSGKRVLYESPGHEYEPRFIEGGRKVLFVSDFVVEKRPGQGGNSIYSIDADGVHPRNLLPLRFIEKNFFCFGLVPTGLLPTGNEDQVYFEGRYSEGRKRTPSVYRLDLSRDSVRQVLRCKYAITDLKVVPK